MSHEEAIAIKIYYEALESANERNVELRYNSKDEIKYFNNTKLTKKVYYYIYDFLDDDNRDYYINIIADFVTKLDDVHSGKKVLNF